jgi:hypothetical protein
MCWWLTSIRAFTPIPQTAKLRLLSIHNTHKQASCTSISQQQPPLRACQTRLPPRQRSHPPSSSWPSSVENHMLSRCTKSPSSTWKTG